MMRSSERGCIGEFYSKWDLERYSRFVRKRRFLLMGFYAGKLCFHQEWLLFE
ncbi:hypothetical protein HMPREF3156_01400 [Neisseria sp. HMSC06F02]|nr:hypothetical protein HMPREF3156_01400 [Neisseria sp. HMSC06F02]